MAPRRLAKHEGAIYLDLCDEEWRAVKVTAEKWEIITNPPVKFIRPVGTRPLPLPVRDGDILELRRFVNVETDDDFRLTVAWLLCAFRPGYPHAVLVLNGEQGSAKSTTARVLRAIVDPNVAAIRNAPREKRDLIAAARNGHVIALDNLTHIPEWLADGLCCLATGIGFGSRQLYTDTDEMLIEACCPIILIGIPDLITRADLGNRALVVTLPPIPAGRRLPEKVFRTEFESARPRILGALLDALACGLRRLPPKGARPGGVT